MDFKAAAFIIANLDSTLTAAQVLAIADALADNTPAYRDRTPTLVESALDSGAVLDHIRAGQKIPAIKALRVVTGCGLKEAKDAVEDARVREFYPSSHRDSPYYISDLHTDPWDYTDRPW